jgi:ferredoxin
VSIIGVLAVDAADKNTELNLLLLLLLLLLLFMIITACMYCIKSCPATAMHAARGK